MSFFIASIGDRSRDALVRFEVLAARHGSQKVETVEVGKFQIDIYSDVMERAPPVFHHPNGDFGAAFGAFIYRDQAGPAAIEAFACAFNSDHVNWADLRGHFVVIIKRDDDVYVLADGLGAAKIYTSEDGTVISNSFIAVAEIVGPRRINTQACYEYLWTGGIYGEQTPFEDILPLAPHRVLMLADGEVSSKALNSPPLRNGVKFSSRDDAVAHHAGQIKRTLAPIADIYGESLTSALSGGFDSRLQLAAFLNLGIKPHLFVYGRDSDADVRIAKVAAAHVGLDIRHTDKSKHELVPPSEYARVVEDAYFCFDGLQYLGIFSDGADCLDRRNRVVGARVPVNGSLGEIYRNFHYLPDHKFSAGDVVDAFYTRLDPAFCTELYNHSSYRENLAKTMCHAVGTVDSRLSRSDVELLYPLIRGRYWTGQGVQSTQRFGHMFFPYLETGVIAGTADLPISWKDYGTFQGLMIKSLWPKLAEIPTDRGYLPGETPNLRHKLSYWGSKYRPVRLRRNSYLLQHRMGRLGLPDEFLKNTYLEQVIDVDFPYMRYFLKLEKVRDNEVLNRAATLEYLFERVGPDFP